MHCIHCHCIVNNSSDYFWIFCNDTDDAKKIIFVVLGSLTHLRLNISVSVLVLDTDLDEVGSVFSHLNSDSLVELR